MRDELLLADESGRVAGRKGCVSRLSHLHTPQLVSRLKLQPVSSVSVFLCAVCEMVNRRSESPDDESTGDPMMTTGEDIDDEYFMQQRKDSSVIGSEDDDLMMMSPNQETNGRR